MTICINCNTQNTDTNLFCQNCGSDLLLQGRYRAIQQLGSGGFGTTYEIDDQGIAKVLKVLRHQSDTAIRLFQREAQFLASNNYPGIPKAEHNSYFKFEAKNSQQPIHCLVMEKIEGMNLKDYIKQSGKPISGDLGLRWLKEIVEILDQVHNQDIIHRDIKPQNIMLQPNGKLTLIDFGAVTDEGIVGGGTETATAASGTQTATHAGEGTRIFSKGYAAPEQIVGKAIKQSDIYSLGRTFVYLLTAKEPNDPVMYDAFNDKVNWRSHSQGVLPQLADLIDEMIQRIPAQRPANTKEILEKLQQIGGVAKKGEDIEINLGISEVQAAEGTEKPIEVTRRININGKLQAETKKLTLKIPAGAKEGQKMRLPGQGNAGEYGGENGDVYVRLSVSKTSSHSSKQQNHKKKSGCIKPLAWGSLGLGLITFVFLIFSNIPYPPEGYPKRECGTGRGYRVFILYTQDNLNTVKKDFCQDVEARQDMMKPGPNGTQWLQVASFRNEEEAQDFISLLEKHFGKVATETVP